MFVEWENRTESVTQQQRKEREVEEAKKEREGEIRHALLEKLRCHRPEDVRHSNKHSGNFRFLFFFVSF